MSLKYYSLVWENSRHGGNELLLLLAYADYADHNGVAWPKMETLAKKVRKSVRQIQRYKAVLIKSGELEIVERGTGKNTSDRVRITIGKGDTYDTPKGDTYDTPKGDTYDTPKGDTYDTPKGDTYDTPKVTHMTPPYIYDPSDEPSITDPSSLRSSSSSNKDLVLSAQKIDDDDDFDFLFKLICSEFSLTTSSTLRGTVKEWLTGHPASTVEAAIRRAVSYSPKSPVKYVQGILDGEVGRQRPKRSSDPDRYSIPSDLANIAIGVD